MEIVQATQLLQHGLGVAPVALAINCATVGTFFALSDYQKLFKRRGHDELLSALQADGVHHIRIMQWLIPSAEFAGGLALVSGTLAVIAALGLAGTTWFNRHDPGFGPAQSLLGGKGLDADLLGTLTVILIPVEIALIVLALVGFAQGWNVETEVTNEEADKRGSKIVARGPESATA